MAAGLGMGALPVSGADSPAAIASLAACKVKEFGGKMPLAVDQRIERQNSPADRLVVEVTHSVKEGGQYVAYVKVVWGDLDNLIKDAGKKHYAKWDGSLALVGANGIIDEKIQFDDGKGAATLPKTTTAKNPGKAGGGSKGNEGPHEGSGRDQVDVAAGSTVKWEAAVVGALDGLRIKITSPAAEIHGTLKAGNFTIPLVINPDRTLSTPSAKPLPNAKTAQPLTVKPVEPKMPRTAPINPNVKSGTSFTVELVPNRS